MPEVTSPLPLSIFYFLFISDKSFIDEKIQSLAPCMAVLLDIFLQFPVQQ